MALTQAEKLRIAMDAVKDNIPWDGVDRDGNATPDTRTMVQLEEAFLERHLYGGLVKTYQDSQARISIERFTRGDVV